MAKKKTAISSASASLSSHVYVKRLSPNTIESNTKTIGIHMSRDTAIELATKILAVANDEGGKDRSPFQGDIMLTGHKHSNEVTILRKPT